MSKLPSRNFGLCGDHNYFEVNIAKSSQVLRLIMTTCPKGKCEQIKPQVA